MKKKSCSEKSTNTLNENINPGSKQLADSFDFRLLGAILGKDVKSALKEALSGGAIFNEGTNPLFLFRQAVATAIRDIESHPRGKLFQKFLLKGPYEDSGEIPKELIGKRLSDSETASAITFIYSHMVNCFKGAVTELLASRACMQLMNKLQRNGNLPTNARLFVGDAVAIRRAHGKGFLKGADMHIMIHEDLSDGTTRVNLAGVVEVKSYFQPLSKMQKQLEKNLLRTKQGIRVREVEYSGDSITTGYGKYHKVLFISVVPDKWKLPRSFRFEESKNGHFLHVDPGIPPRRDDEIKQIGENDWLITLKWSKEALAKAAYEMTFWYMGKVGEIIYSKSVPKGWEEMSPAAAGRNAITMMLYYAIMRASNAREEHQAIALYNSYGFEYALGMNFRNKEGKLEMLWPQDLDEILFAGETKKGCAIE